MTAYLSSNLTILFLGALGTLCGFAAVYWYIYNKYEILEQKVLDAIAAYSTDIYETLDRMYQRKPMNKVYILILVPTIVMALLGFSLGLNISLLSGLMLAGFFAMIGYKLPGKIIKMIFNRRILKFDRQLVDALNMMANAIKSGLSFMQVVQVIEKEMPDPCAQEFGMVIKENRVGVNLNDALLNMTKRVPSDDLFMIINSVVTLSQQGGDLSEAFETIAVTIRERQRVSEKIRTMAQAGITQGSILAFMPFAMMGMMYIMQPEYIKLLFGTTVGLGMLVGMLVLIFIGALWIRKILNIEV
jgi:tight adherence protein B